MAWRTDKRGIPVVVVALTVLLPALFLLYVAGYFVLGSDAPEEWPLRVFYAPWQCQIYKPAVQVETRLTGKEVEGAWMQPNTVRRPKP